MHKKTYKLSPVMAKSREMIHIYLHMNVEINFTYEKVVEDKCSKEYGSEFEKFLESTVEELILNKVHDIGWVEFMSNTGKFGFELWYALTEFFTE
jgi:hypothetical protein